MPRVVRKPRRLYIRPLSEAARERAWWKSQLAIGVAGECPHCGEAGGAGEMCDTTGCDGMIVGGRRTLSRVLIRPPYANSTNTVALRVRVQGHVVGETVHPEGSCILMRGLAWQWMPWMIDEDGQPMPIMALAGEEPPAIVWCDVMVTQPDAELFRGLIGKYVRVVWARGVLQRFQVLEPKPKPKPPTGPRRVYDAQRMCWVVKAS